MGNANATLGKREGKALENKLKKLLTIEKTCANIVPVPVMDSLAQPLST